MSGWCARKETISSAPGRVIWSPPKSRWRRRARSRAGFTKVKRLLIGHPLTTASAAHERLTKVKALAVLSSDALSSVAYATEEILRVLAGCGRTGGAAMSACRSAAAIIALLDHRRHLLPADDQGLPHGGGSYIVAKDNLGDGPALTAGAALLAAYTLTVAVSIAAVGGGTDFRLSRSCRTHRVGDGHRASSCS